MTETETETDTAAETDTETQEYRLQDDVDRVVRSGLVLEGDETVTLDDRAAAQHEDVLEPVSPLNPDADDEDETDQEGET